MKEMRLFYTPVWPSNVADGEAAWSGLRAAMLERIATVDSPAAPRWAKLPAAATQCRWCPALPFLRIDSTQMLAGSTCRL